MKLKRKDSQIDSKSFVSWVYAVFQQHCMQKESVKLDKPVYAQMAILENSKILIYDSNTVQSANFIYTDTGSLLLEIQTRDVCKDTGE